MNAVTASMARTALLVIGNCAGQRSSPVSEKLVPGVRDEVVFDAGLLRRIVAEHDRLIRHHPKLGHDGVGRARDAEQIGRRFRGTRTRARAAGDEEQRRVARDDRRPNHRQPVTPDEAHRPRPRSATAATSDPAASRLRRRPEASRRLRIGTPHPARRRSDRAPSPGRARSTPAPARSRPSPTRRRGHEPPRRFAGRYCGGADL